MKRADAILITRIHLVEDPSRLLARIASLAPKARVFKSGHHIRNFYSPQNGQTIDRQRLQDMKTGVLAAIGNPLVFLKDLKRAGIRPQKRFFFRDHHVFQARELKEVAARCQQVGITTLLTTEKDAVRMQATHLSGIELCVVAIRAYVEDEGSLDEWLLQKLSETAGLDSMKTPQPPLVT